MQNNDYISSDGTRMDITKLNTERLINSLAKHHRDIYNSDSIKQFVFHSEQISLIEGELLRRNKEFYNQKIGGGLWQ